MDLAYTRQSNRPPRLQGYEVCRTDKEDPDYPGQQRRWIIATFQHEEEAKAYCEKRAPLTEEQCEQLDLLEQLVLVIGWESEAIEFQTNEPYEPFQCWFLQGLNGPFLQKFDVGVECLPEQQEEMRERLGCQNYWWEGFGVRWHSGGQYEPPSWDEYSMTSEHAKFEDAAAELMQNIVTEMISEVLANHQMSLYDKEPYEPI